MSTYYLYYLGYQDKDGMIYPLGPFDNKGKLHPVSDRSRSFASDLYEYFNCVKEEDKSEELIKALHSSVTLEEYKEWNDFEKEVRYLPISELGSSDFIKKGYFLIEDIKLYKETESLEDLFYERMSSEEYAAKLVNEMTFGPPKPKLDCEGNEIETYSCRDYSYFAYADEFSKEYDAYLLKTTAEMYSFYNYEFGDNGKIVALFTWG